MRPPLNNGFKTGVYWVRFQRLLSERRDWALLVLSTALAPLLAFLAAPLITRLYSPSEFGLLAAFIAIFTPLLSIVNARYEIAIPLTQTDTEARSLADSSIFIGFAVAFIASFAAWFLVPVVFENNLALNLRRHFWWLPLALIVGGGVQVLTQVAIRQRDFPILAKARLAQGVLGPGVQIALGFINAGYLGLLIGQLASQFGGIVGLSKSFFKLGNEKVANASKLMLLTRYRNFPRISLFPAFINAIGLQLPIIAVAKLHGAESAGLIGLVFRVIGAPVSILASATSQFILSEGGKARRSDLPVGKIFSETLTQQLWLSIPLLLSVPAYPWLFEKLFGERWVESGYFGVILGPAIIIQACCSPLGSILDILERQDLHFLREILRLIFLASAIWIGVYVIGTIWALVVALSVSLIATGLTTVLFAKAALRAAQKDFR
jgi:O-antigen/teichoic acid export membrane protein